MIMNNNNPQSSLPPGFRFHPTDEELILHYLRKKVSSTPLPVSIIAEVDIYKFNPWELPAQATFGEKEWYFFTPRDRKYPNGARPNRAAGSGYWKATGTDKVIMTSSGERLTSDNIGVKKALVFYTGRPPKGSKTNWIMHEYRLAESPCTAAASILRPMKLNKGSPMRLDDWVLCRIYKKSIVSPSAAAMASLMIDRDQAVEEEDRFLLQDITLPNFPIQMNMNMSQKCSSFNNLLDALDYSLLSSLLSEPNHNQTNDLSCFGPPCSNVHSSSFEPQDFSVSGSLDTMYENNGLKRQQSCIFDAEMSYPSTKKFNGSSCNFMNNNGVSQFDISGQHSMFSNHSLLNQHQLVLSDKVQFLG